MTNYAGEAVRLRAKDVKDFDGNPLTVDKVSRATVTIWTSDYSRQVLEPTTLPFDEEAGTWAYVWNTADMVPGTYRARLLFVTVDELESWEYKRVRLHKDPAPVPTP